MGLFDQEFIATNLLIWVFDNGQCPVWRLTSQFCLIWFLHRLNCWPEIFHQWINFDGIWTWCNDKNCLCSFVVKVLSCFLKKKLQCIFWDNELTTKDMQSFEVHTESTATMFHTALTHVSVQFIGSLPWAILQQEHSLIRFQNKLCPNWCSPNWVKTNEFSLEKSLSQISNQFFDGS